MDVKTMLDNLHDQVSCSVCMCTFTEPKQLPCLHSFCLHCLNGIHRTSPNRGVISCPECRKQIRIPGSGNPSEFPTNFRINSLLDVLAIKKCNTAGVKCGNCDKRSTNCFYCFPCCSFWCEDCITAHNIIRSNKDHRVLAITDFQDQDIEEVLKRPAFCHKKHHEKEELKFFCKVCKAAICNACALTDHEGHTKILMESATHERKLHFKSVITSLKEKAQEERSGVGRLKQSNVDVQKKLADVKSKVQATADQIIALIEARKQDIFNAVDNQATETLNCLALKESESKEKLKLIESTIEKTENLLKRSSNAEILAFNIDETFGRIFEDQGVQGTSDSVRIPYWNFNENKKVVSMLNTEGIGSVKAVFSTAKGQQPSGIRKENSKVVAGFEGKHVRGSAVKVQMQTRQFTHVLSFGQRGESVGMLRNPCGVAVNDGNEIAVTEWLNHRVSVFSSDGTHLRSFGRWGVSEGEFQCPSGIAFDTNGNIIVVDCNNNRIQMFTRNGEFLSKFGDQGSHDHQLKNPEGLSGTTTGDIIVADYSNQFIKLFSPRGQFVCKIGGEGSLECPYHCIQTEQYLIVSDPGDDCIKVFDWEGNFLFKFGKQGDKDGEFSSPGYLSVNKDGHLMVCDSGNNRVQVFEMNGNFVTKFGRAGSGRGEFWYPMSTANRSDGRIVVCDTNNHRVQIFELV